jgi:hypothetical protein
MGHNTKLNTDRAQIEALGKSDIKNEWNYYKAHLRASRKETCTKGEKK